MDRDMEFIGFNALTNIRDLFNERSWRMRMRGLNDTNQRNQTYDTNQRDEEFKKRMHQFYDNNPISVYVFKKSSKSNSNSKTPNQVCNKSSSNSKFNKLNFNLKNIILDFLPFIQNIEQNTIINKLFLQTLKERSFIVIYKNLKTMLKEELSLSTITVKNLQSKFFSNALEKQTICESLIHGVFGYILSYKYKQHQKVFLLREDLSANQESNNQEELSSNSNSNLFSSNYSYWNNKKDLLSFGILADINLHKACFMEFLRALSLYTRNRGSNNSSLTEKFSSLLDDFDYTKTAAEIFIGDNDDNNNKKYSMSTKTILKQLTTSSSCLIMIDLSNALSVCEDSLNNNHKITISSLCEVLKENQVLKELNLSNNFIGYKEGHIKSLLLVLKENENLVYLNLSDNGFSLKDVDEIFNFLENNKSIKQFYFRDNKSHSNLSFGKKEQVFASVFDSIRANKTLELIDISSFGLIMAQQSYLFIKEIFNTSLKSLDVSYRLLKDKDDKEFFYGDEKNSFCKVLE